VSRPTNPTGNVLTDDEVAQLDRLARAPRIPLIIDGAYGAPFPNILFTPGAAALEREHHPGAQPVQAGPARVRTGIVVAREEIAHAFANANGILNLASGNLGPAVAMELFRTGEILDLARTVVQPFYQARARAALDEFRERLAGLPFRIHRPEGAFFLWLWFEGCPSAARCCTSA